jgi:hypothetical protein
MTKSQKLAVANQILGQLEQLHADIPGVDRAFEEANKIAVKAAREALTEWVNRS